MNAIRASATLGTAISCAALCCALLSCPAEAEPPSARATGAKKFQALRLPSAGGTWQLSESSKRFPANFTPPPDLGSRDYLRTLSLPTMGGDGRGVRDESPAEQLARQVHREGLPLARLWQNDQALVSFGLNRKGKPGLWIIQKTR